MNGDMSNWQSAFVVSQNVACNFGKIAHISLNVLKRVHTVLRKSRKKII